MNYIDSAALQVGDKNKGRRQSIKNSQFFQIA